MIQIEIKIKKKTKSTFKMKSTDNIFENFSYNCFK